MHIPYINGLHLLDLANWQIRDEFLFFDWLWIVPLDIFYNVSKSPALLISLIYHPKWNMNGSRKTTPQQFRRCLLNLLLLLLHLHWPQYHLSLSHWHAINISVVLPIDVLRGVFLGPDFHYSYHKFKCGCLS